MRWIGIMLALCVLGFVTWGGAEPDAGKRTESAMNSPFVRSAMAGEFSQRHANFGIGCTACHGDEPDYSTTPTTVQCLICHDSHDAVAALTGEMIPNPHHSHMGEVACVDCHSEHSESRLSCNQCHVFEMDVP